MIIRESPNAKGSPQKASWPPRSPHEALLSSPSGKKRLQSYRPSSPSPSKRRRISNDQASDDDDEDEEAIQLRLEEIKLQQKLRKLQKAKKDATRNANSNDFVRQEEVQVPHSPKLSRVAEPHGSPKRVQMGIDKGLRAEDVSLKRAKLASEKAKLEAKRAAVRPQAKAKTFTERLLEGRSHEKEREEKRQKIERSRSQGFGLARPASNTSTAQQLSKPQSQPAFKQPGKVAASSRSAGDDSLRISSTDSRATRKAPRSPSSSPPPSNAGATKDFDPFSSFDLSTRHTPHSTLTTALEDKQVMSIPTLLKAVVAPDYDPPDIDTPSGDFVVTGIIASKSSPYTHTDKHKTANPKTGSCADADPEDDAASQKTKFMVLKLTDLKWEVDLFLFGPAFTAFWKLTPGTVIAVLNPGIMPPKPHMAAHKNSRYSGAFSLKLGSSEDTVLEIGTSRHLGWCKSVKKDGKVCGSWIDGRRSEFCEFHMNLGVERARAGRMEVNGMVGVGLFGNTVRNERSKSGRNTGRGGGRGGRGGRGRGGLLHEGPRFDRATGETLWDIPKEFSSGGTTAKMLDSEDYAHGGMSKAERSQKRLAAFEKERELAKALGSKGGGLGSEYMRLKRSDKPQHGEEGYEEPDEDSKPKDAAALGLLGGNAGEVRLSPSKKRKVLSVGGKGDPRGWSGAFKRTYVEPPEKEDEPGIDPPKEIVESMSPRKKARFLIEKKGIRVPGRDSLGVPEAKEDPDDDDLDII